jgi:alkanesulfonate monooxygenase SsuD/methylene tetrahydromethanopterin reductase-like flavin-dependent oxidoreductase (luciferase family)
VDFSIISEAYLSTGDDEHSRYPEVLEEFIVAEEAGFDAVGISEQHFNAPMYTFASAEPFYGALAARTERLKIRTMSMILPYHHPLNTAERVATLDIVSNGRLEFGTGRGNSAYSLAAYGMSPTETQQRWRECMEIVLGCWEHDEFGYEGEYYSFPARAVRPKPIQQPHPPLWYSAISPQSAEFAGGLGFAMMTQTVGIRRDQVASRIASYRDAFHASTEYLARVPLERVCLYTLGFCHEDRKVALERARAPMLEYLRRTADMYEVTMRAQGLNLDFEKLRATMSDFDAVVEQGMVMVGDPDDCVRWLHDYASLGVEEFCFRFEGVSHDDALGCIRRMGADVLPRCREPLAAAHA